MDIASIDHVMTTTRSVRKRLDFERPVEPQIIQQCIDIALQAPNGGNRGRYHFVVVSDPEKRAKLADLYRKGFAEFLAPNKESYGPAVFESAKYLAEHLHEVPLHIIPCIEGRAEEGTPFMQANVYGSVLPAAWSLMMALRARGLGSSWTTLHLMYEAEAASLLKIPENVTQGVLLPVAYFTGDDFRPALRARGSERTYWNTWQETR